MKILRVPYSHYVLSYDIVDKAYSEEQIEDFLYNEAHAQLLTMQKPVKSTIYFSSKTRITTIDNKLRHNFPNMNFAISKVEIIKDRHKLKYYDYWGQIDTTLFNDFKNNLKKKFPITITKGDLLEIIHLSSRI